MKFVLFFLFVAIFSFCNGDDFAENYTNFLGEKWWNTDELELCDDVSKDVLWRRNDSICLTYVYNLLPVDLEIISWSPALIIYRNLLTARQKNDFLDYIKQTEMIHQKTSDYGVTRETTQRRANGSFIQHGETPVTAEIHRKLQQRIPALNFESAESFSALSYLPGGHYSVHSDYLLFKSEDLWDWWMKNYRNRIGTLIFVLETAQSGGGTIFPVIGTTVRVNAGDAFFWFSARADEQQETLTNHGGCPVHSGRKVISTLWIRAKHQPLIPMLSPEEPIRADWMIPGLTEQFKSGLRTECPAN